MQKLTGKTKKKRDKKKKRRNGKSTFQLILIKSALGPKGSCRKGINLERGYFALIDSIAVFFVKLDNFPIYTFGP